MPTRRISFLALLITIIYFLSNVHIVSAEVLASQEQINSYLDAFSSNFNNLILNTSTKNEFFYEKTVYISNKSGIAIEFFPSVKEKTDFIYTEKEVEEYIFPDIDFQIPKRARDESELKTVLIGEGQSNIPMFNVGDAQGTGFSNLFIITNKMHFIEISNKGETCLNRMIIDGKYFHFVVIRGNNQDNWTEANAIKDSINLYIEESEDNFIRSIELRSFTAITIIEELISQLEIKHQNAREIGFSFQDFQREYETIHEIAVSQYGLNSQLLEDILYYYRTIAPKPAQSPWYEVAPWSWILGCIVGLVFDLAMPDETKKKIRSKLLKTLIKHKN